MKISVNGKEKEFGHALSMLDLLQSLELDPARVAVELNRQILARDRFSEIFLSEGDRLEIVQFVGGG